MEVKDYRTLIMPYEVSVDLPDGSTFSGAHEVYISMRGTHPVEVRIVGNNLPREVVVNAEYKNEKIRLELEEVK